MKNSKLWRWWNFGHRFEKHVVLIVAWALLALGLCRIFPRAAALLYAGLLCFIFMPRSRQLLYSVLAVGILTQSYGQSFYPPQTPTQPDDPQCILCIEALVVIAVGVIVLQEYVRFCNGEIPLPPVPTNNIPTNAIPTNGFPRPFPAVCILTNNGPSAMGQRSFSMSVTVAPDGSLALSPMPVNAYWDQDWNTLTYSQWTNALYSGWGVNPVTTTSTVSPQPGNLQASYAGGVLSVTEQGEPTRTIVLYRSADLLNWLPISTNIWSARFTQVMAVDPDAPEQAAFYKVQ